MCMDFVDQLHVDVLYQLFGAHLAIDFIGQFKAQGEETIWLVMFQVSAIMSTMSCGI